MYATLYAFLQMSPADRALVTHLDLSIASEEDLYRSPPIFVPSLDPAASGLGLAPPSAKDWEEWPGETGYTYPERTRP